MPGQSHHSSAKPPFRSGWQVEELKAQPAAAGWSQLGKRALKTRIEVMGYITPSERQAVSSDAVNLLAGDGAEGVHEQGKKKTTKKKPCEYM